MRKKSLLICGLIIISVSCSKSSKESISSIIYDYDLTQDKTIEWNDLFNQNPDFYYVYVYSPKCGYCNDIKQDVLNYCFNLSSSMYFVCTDNDIVIGPPKDLVGLNNIEEFYIFGTPFLIEVKERAVANYYAGKEEILAFISIWLKNN